MKLYRGNHATLHITYNPIFHERTNHIEIDCNFIREKLLTNEISTKLVNTNDQLAGSIDKVF